MPVESFNLASVSVFPKRQTCRRSAQTFLTRREIVRLDEKGNLSNDLDPTTVITDGLGAANTTFVSEEGLNAGHDVVCFVQKDFRRGHERVRTCCAIFAPSVAAISPLASFSLRPAIEEIWSFL
jgi:hypothetical protein